MKRVFRGILLPVEIAAIAAAWLLRSQSVALAPAVVPAFLALVYADYYLVHRRLQEVKRKEGWYAGQRQAAVASLDAPGDARPLPRWPLAAALLIIAATAAVGILRYPLLPAHLAVHFNASGLPDRFAVKSVFSAFSGVWVQIGTTALLTATALGVRRMRQDLDPADPQASAKRHALFRGAMAHTLMVLMALVDLTMLFASLRTWGLIPSPGLAPFLIVGPVLLGTLYAVFISLRLGQGGSRLPQPAAPQTGFVRRDDDRYWKGGGLYVNRQDPSIIVQRRFGVGWTLNFGHPVSWLLIAALIALMLFARRGL